MTVHNYHTDAKTGKARNSGKLFSALIDSADKIMANDLDKARSLYEQALAVAQTSSDHEGCFKARMHLEICRTKSGDNITALNNFHALLTEIGDQFPSIKAGIFNQIGTIYFMQTDYSKALSNYINATKMYENIGDIDKQVATLINIAIIHTYRIEFDLVENYLNRCLRLLDATIEELHHGKLLNQFGILYLHKGELDKAQSFFRQASEIYQENENSAGNVECLSNIAVIHMQKGELDEAIRLTNEVLAIWDEQGNKRGRAIGLKNLASLFWKKQRYSEAIESIREMLAIGRELNNRHLIYEALKSLADVQGYIGEYESAYKNLMEFISVFTEVHSDEEERELAELTAKYDVERNQREAEIHRLRNVELAKAQRLARLGSWEWDIESQTFECSREFYSLLGFNPDKDQIQPEAILTLVRAENKAEALEAVRLMLLEHRDLDLTVSVIRKDGVERFMKVQGEYSTRRDAFGKPSIFGTVQDITDQKNAQAEREKLITELKEALANVKALRGLLPICAHCKKIRDDQGYWNQLETYISENSDAKFTHGICPECMIQHYSDQPNK